MNNKKIMRQMKKINVIIILILGIFLATGCGDDNNLPVDTHEDAFADVIVKKVNANGNAKYKLMFFAGGAEIAKEGSTVTTTDGKTYELKQFWAGLGKVRFGGYPLSANKPATGEYTFKLKFNDGYEKEMKDVVSDIDVGLVTGLIVNHEEGSDSISATWAGGENADMVCLKLTELDMASTKPLFKIAAMPKDKKSYSFDVSTNAKPGWMRNPSELVRGTKYWLVISAKKVEEGSKITGASQDFEQNSCTKVKITW